MNYFVYFGSILQPYFQNISIQGDRTRESSLEMIIYTFTFVLIQIVLWKYRNKYRILEKS